MNDVRTMLSGELLTLAFCWRLERRDGVTIGLTSHDRDLVVGGLRYRAAPGIVPSAVTGEAGLDPGGMDITGALTSTAITQADLEAGRWDGAALWLMLTQWEAPGVLWHELARGTLGEVTRTGARFSAELRAPLAQLDGPVAPATSPGCCAMLGDARCGVDLARHRVLARVTGVEDRRMSLAPATLVPGRFAFGQMRFLTGADTGARYDIADNGADHVLLSDDVRVEGVTGALVHLVEGCDKRIATCADRFANAVNFRGEPYLPGNDLLTRYPGA